MNKKQKPSLFSVFFTFVVDNLGATIVYPIFAPLFLDPSENLFDPDTSELVKTTLLGLFLGAFPLAQFFFNPIMGDYSDRKGRKNALVLTVCLTFLGFLISAYSVQERLLIPLFIGRLIMGCGAANLSVCLSTLSDVSHCESERGRYLSLGSALAGLTFVLGPFIGGKLSDPSVNPIFSPSFPLWLSAGLALVNFLFVAFVFKETNIHKTRKDFDFMAGVRNVQLAFKTKRLRKLFLIYFFYLFGWNIIFLFIPAFLVQNFKWSNSQIGDAAAIMGLCWIVGTFLMHRLSHRLLHVKCILLIAFVAFAGTTFTAPYLMSPLYFLIFLGISVALAGLIWPIATEALSRTTVQISQGKILGLSQSMLSFNMMLAAFIGGAFLHAHTSIPFILAAISSLLAASVVKITKL